MPARQDLKGLHEILNRTYNCGRFVALTRKLSGDPTYGRAQPLDGGPPDIAYRTRAKLPIQSARSLRSLPRSLARATHSKDRREKTVEVGTPPTGCRDEPRNKAPPAPSPPLHNPPPRGLAKPDRYFSSFVCRTHACAELDVGFLSVAGIGDAGRYEGGPPFARAGITDPGYSAPTPVRFSPMPESTALPIVRLLTGNVYV